MNDKTGISLVLFRLYTKTKYLLLYLLWTPIETTFFDAIV